MEQYTAIADAICTYLRSIENDDDEEDVQNENGKEEKEVDSKYLTWGKVVEWYLSQCEQQIGDSVDELRRLQKLTNLVIRRLITVDHVLIYISGEAPEGTPEEERVIAVHPNYDIRGGS